jgi:endonuclease/exonuclease/phosphatase family metal-dependent hydrolase
MTISLLQLNINADNYWDKLIPYLSEHDYDIIQLQELTGDKTQCGNINSQRDTFAELQQVLRERYAGELTLTQRFTSSPTSYLGNATFYKKTFSLIEKKEHVLSHFVDYLPSNETNFAKVGRKLLHLTLAINNKQISFCNTHFAWWKTPREQPHQTTQGEIFLDYMQKVAKPFVLTGDFNLTPDQPLIKKLDTLGQNITRKYNITNTLDPLNHNVKELFPAGLAVDYIFVSDDVNVQSFSVVEEHLSDHFGLIATFEV